MGVAVGDRRVEYVYDYLVRRLINTMTYDLVGAGATWHTGSLWQEARVCREKVRT